MEHIIQNNVVRDYKVQYFFVFRILQNWFVNGTPKNIELYIRAQNVA